MALLRWLCSALKSYPQLYAQWACGWAALSEQLAVFRAKYQKNSEWMNCGDTAAIQKEELDKELAEMKQPFNSAFSEESPMAQSVDQVEKPQPADSPKASQTTDSDSKSSNA